MNLTGLKGLTEKNSAFVRDVNASVLNKSFALLSNKGLVIFEEALIEAKQRKNRQYVQWKVIRNDLLEMTGRAVLITVSYGFLRDQVTREVDPLKAPYDVKEYLKFKKGGQTAGFCFTETYEELSRRQMLSRMHVAEGFQKSITLIEDDLGRHHRLPEPPAVKEISDGP